MLLITKGETLPVIRLPRLKISYFSIVLIRPYVSLPNAYLNVTQSKATWPKRKRRMRVRMRAVRIEGWQHEAYDTIIDFGTFRIRVTVAAQHNVTFTPSLFRCPSYVTPYIFHTCNANTQNATNCFPTFRKLCVLKFNGARRHRIYIKAGWGHNKALFVQQSCWSMHNYSLLKPLHQSDKVRRLPRTWQAVPSTHALRTPYTYSIRNPW
jgi:hypothetical protein